MCWPIALNPCKKEEERLLKKIWEDKGRVRQAVYVAEEIERILSTPYCSDN